MRRRRQACGCGSSPPVSGGRFGFLVTGTAEPLVAAASSTRLADRRPAGQQVADLLAGQRLVFEQALRQRLELVAVRGQDAPRLGETRLDQAPDLGVDLLRGRLGHVLLPRDRMAEEHLFLVLAVGDRAELVATGPSA